MDRRDKTNYYLDMAQVALERGTTQTFSDKL